MTKTTTNLSSPPRERVSVNITGLDLSTPDDIVADGKCEHLHNLRFEASAWRPVHPYVQKGTIQYPSGKKGSVAYHHPAAGDDVVIIEVASLTVNGSTFDYSSYNTTTGESKAIASFPKQQAISHFGNILYFREGATQSAYLYNGSSYDPAILPSRPYTTSSTTTSGGSKKPTYWMLDKLVRIENLQIGGVRHDFNIPANTPIYFDPIYGTDSLYNGVIDKIRAMYASGELAKDSISVRFLYNLYDYDSALSNMPTISGEDYINTDCWHGEAAFFTAYRMTDGSSIISSSPTILTSNSHFLISHIIRQSLKVLNPLSNIPQYDEQPARLYAYTAFRPITNEPTDYISLSESPISYARHSLTFSIPLDIDTRLFQSVAIYSTRIHQILPVNELLYLPTDEEMQISRIFGDRDLLDEPFYLAKEWNIDALAPEYTIDVEFNNGFFDNIESKPVYVPTQTNTFGIVSLDYNNRRHLANITSAVDSSQFLGNIFAKGTERIASGLVIKDEFAYRNLIGETNSNVSFELSPAFKRMLCFPDVNIDSFIVYRERDTSAYSYRAKVSYKNNFAYFFGPPTKAIKYPVINLSDDATDRIDASSLSSDNLFIRPNKLKVSASNNSLIFPFENTYSIGSPSNRIIAMQSAAIEMPEMKVGEMPLYVFTTEGIYALVAGSETLYARVSPINYDKVINPNVIAINGALVYITEKGVHLLTSEGTKVVSTPIHDKGNRPPLDFLRTCQMFYPKEHTEVVFLNPSLDYSFAYILNLDGMYWSTRDLKGKKLNTDELINGVTIYDLSNEDENANLDVTLSTRPMKLGDVEFKRVETFIPRLYSGSDPISLDASLSGSVDGKNYMPLRDISVDNIPRMSNDPLVLRRTPFSAKFFKYYLHISPVGTGTFDPTILNIDIEWYKKMRHRMR